jgi:hypothetical protein
VSRKRIIPKKTRMDHGMSVCGVSGVSRDVGGYGR